MAGYTFTPNNSRPQKKQKQKQNNPDQNTGKKSTRDFSKFESTITQFKTSIFIAAALVLMMFMVGPQITGNLLLDSEDKMLAQNSDFPDLSKFEANKQFYLCQNQMNEDLGKLSEYQLELESRSTTAEACIQQKNTLSQQYNTCADELTSTEANFVYCNSSKTALSQEVEMCNDDLEDKNQEYSDFELSNHALTNNYADDYCCIYRTVLGNTDLKYYKLENNKVICTEDSDDDEFDWENC